MIRSSLLFLVLMVLFTGCQLSNENAKSDENLSLDVSCLPLYSIDAEETISNHIYLLIDQTVVFDENIKNNVLSKIKPLVKHGTELTIIKFSTFSEGHYTSIVANYKIEGKLAEAIRNDISRHKLKKLDKCMEFKLLEAKKVIPNVIAKALNDTNESISHSELYKTFQEVSKMKTYRQDKGQRTLVIVSDMLENSSASSFYLKNKIRSINKIKEMKILENSGYKADFLHTHVYVIGAGLLATKYRNKVASNDKIMHSINRFWNHYFKESNAELYGFGMPELLDNIE